MAKVSIEDCLDETDNRFALCLLAAKRAHDLQNGKEALIENKRSVSVVALKEIAAKKVGFKKDPNKLLGVHK